MAPRQISGLRWARPCNTVFVAPKGVKGSRGQGLGYERKVAKALPGAIKGPWFQFEDRNGLGFCQPDFLVCVSGRPVVIETKLTATEQAWYQLEGLYRPVLEHWLGRQVYLVQVCKNLTPAVTQWDCNQLDSLDQLHIDHIGQRNLLPWLGMGSLGTRLAPWAEGFDI